MNRMYFEFYFEFSLVYFDEQKILQELQSAIQFIINDHTQPHLRLF
jgi:hypothetical protein